MGDATFPGAGWEGFIVTRFVPLSDSQCQIDLIPDPQVPARCPRCRRPCSMIHDTTVRRIRDRDLFEYLVWLSVPICRVRVDQANQLRHDKPARRAVKRSRWLLLRNPENLKAAQAGELKALLELNQSLMTVYLMKAQLKELWYARTERAARWLWTRWFNMAQASGLAPLIRFARLLKPYAQGIIASACYRLNTSVLEGMNNRIKVIKRMAYGYRDSDYFFLKIKAAFPGNPR